MKCHLGRKEVEEKDKERKEMVQRFKGTFFTKETICERRPKIKKKRMGR